MILIDVMYIHSYGGKSLLEFLISSIRQADNIHRYLFLLDDRLHSEIIEDIPEINRVVSTAGESRRKAIYKNLFRDTSRPISSVFCFANVPPPISIIKCPVFIYFHNTLLLSTSKSKYGSFTRILYKVKAWYIRFKNKKIYNWLVQSSLVKESLHKYLGIDMTKISVSPFYNENGGKQLNSGLKNFLYVADGVPQKNHSILFKTWKYLASEFQLYPELVLTIDENKYPILISEIEELSKLGINIKNAGHCSYNELIKMYSRYEYLVFPSLNESFGLPLIEGYLAGCKIIAVDLPYVYQVVRPSAVFNLNNYKELANIVFQSVSENVNFPKSELIATNQIFKIIELLNPAPVVE